MELTVLNKFKKFLYNEIYVNILQNSNDTLIFIEEVNFKGDSQHYEKLFKSTDKVKIDEYIQSYVNHSPINYVSILDPSLSQGAAPTCSSSEIKRYCESGEYEQICINESWSYYSSKFDLIELQGRYKTSGLDFIFSPFHMLHDFFKDKTKGEIALYVLVNEDYMALSVFEDSQLMFASLLDMQKEDESSDDLIMDIDDEDELILDEIENHSVDLEDIDVDDDLDNLDELDDLDDLESFDDMEDFDVDSQTEQTLDSADSSMDIIDDQSSFGEDYQRFSLIQSAINTFYKDTKFDGKFIQNAYIADGIGLSSEFKKFLEEEMFLSVMVRKIEMAQELCELAKVEQK